MKLSIHRSRALAYRPRRSESRPAFTLVELLVALVLLDFGLLAVAASSAVAANQLAEARGRSRAAAIGQSRLEWAAAQPCGAAQSGSAAVDRGVREGWTLSASVRETRIITDTVELTLGETTSQELFVSRVVC